MKKPFITFLVVFAIAFGVVAFAEIRKVDNHVAISKSPAFVVAEPQGLTTKTKKGRTTYQVNYIYTVANTEYKIDTDFMDTEAEAMAMAAKPVEVAFPSSTPAEAIFRSEYDQRDPGEGIGSALMTAGGLGLIMALIGTVVLLFKFPSLRRAS